MSLEKKLGEELRLGESYYFFFGWGRTGGDLRKKSLSKKTPFF